MSSPFSIICIPAWRVTQLLSSGDEEALVLISARSLWFNDVGNLV
jgi:hypothetical protein